MVDLILKKYSLLILIGLLIASCRTGQELTGEEFRTSDKEPGELLAELEDYETTLNTISGKARAIISEPGNTERANLTFSSHREKSMVNIRNGLGMEGGELLTDGDTLLVYNKIDEYVRKIAIREGQLDNINRLASLNILQMISYTVSEEQVRELSENNSQYRLLMHDGAELIMDKEALQVQEVRQPEQSQLPYSRITYDGYADINGFVLPRRISIFGTDGESKVALQVTSLQVNPALDSLTLNYPDDIPVYHQ